MGSIEICLVGLAVVILSILWLRLHAFLGLLLGAFVVSILTPEVGVEAMSRVAEGFGTGCRKIGILIALAAIIGQCLLVSGAAERIVKGLLSLFGVKRGSNCLSRKWICARNPSVFRHGFLSYVTLGPSLFSHESKGLSSCAFKCRGWGEYGAFASAAYPGAFVSSGSS
jgi:GntP family gluconate:H+ symporter